MPHCIEMSTTRRSSLPKSSLFSHEQVNRPLVPSLFAATLQWFWCVRFVPRAVRGIDGCVPGRRHQSRAAPRRALLGGVDHRVLGVHHRAGRLRIRPGRRGRGRARRRDPRPAGLHRGALRRSARRPLPPRAPARHPLVRPGRLHGRDRARPLCRRVELARLRAERRRRADGEHGAPDAVRAASPAREDARGADRGEPRPDDRRELRDLPRPRARRDPARGDEHADRLRRGCGRLRRRVGPARRAEGRSRAGARRRGQLHARVLRRLRSDRERPEARR